MRTVLLSLLILSFVGCGGEPDDGGAPATAPATRAVMAALERALGDSDRGVRYAAILALGKGGVDPEVLLPLVRDAHWCVRTEAQWWCKRLAEPGRGANAAVDEHYEIPASPRPPTLSAEATDKAVKALASGEREARVQAALDLGAASFSNGWLLQGALKDPSWRVRAALLRSLRHLPAEAEWIAPFLRSEIVPEAEAACETLKALGAAAAAPTAAAMADAHYGALHWGLTIFEHLGQDGAGGVALLLTQLASEDVNAREIAARCLRAIGPPALAAASALVRALGDARLCVVAQAALALGALGVTHEAFEALGDPRARVRAYAAFALGWALGAERKIDQVPFEHRLPVLELGLTAAAPGPAEVDIALHRTRMEEDDDGDEVEVEDPDVDLLLRAIWSGRPEVAIRAAAELHYQPLDARHAERVMELLLPEGARTDAPGDFESIRSIIGSAEVPAYLMYVFKAGLSEGRQESIGGNFHRLALPWHLPVLAWFHRTHDRASWEHTGELWFSQWYSDQHARVITLVDLEDDPGPDLRAIVKAQLMAATTEPTFDVLPLPRWHLARIHFRDEDAAWLVPAARRLDGGDGSTHGTWRWAWIAALRALSRLGDDASLAYLREVARPLADAKAAAIAGLARRGDEAALAELVRRANTWALGGDDAEECLLHLFDMRPELGRRITVKIIEKLAGPAKDEDGEESAVAILYEWDEYAIPFGIDVDASAFLGLGTALEPLLPKLTATQLAELLRHMPLCNTRSIAEALFRALENESGFGALGLDEEDEDAGSYAYAEPLDAALAPLHALDPDRLVRLLRRIGAEGKGHSRTYALNVLLRLGDTASRDAILVAARAELPGLFDEQYDGDWQRLPGAATEAYLVRLIGLERKDGDVPDGSLVDLVDLAVLRGLSSADARELRRRLWDSDGEALMDLVVGGSLDTLRSRLGASRAAQPGTAAERLFWKTQFGDQRARAELWSILRTARYRNLHHSDDPPYLLRRDLSTLPHWITELESNCCRVSDGLDAYVFEDRGLGLPALYGTEANGVGTSLAARALRWMRVMGGDFVWSPITDTWVRRPE